VALGEQVVLLRSTVPVARLVPYRARTKRQFGRFEGRLRIGEDFDAPASSGEGPGLVEPRTGFSWTPTAVSEGLVAYPSSGSFLPA
jgi:antitoxin (DNA-binding transcriptional repressor) of toxin-antitoxin stability system